VPLGMALNLGGKGLDAMASGVMKLSDSLQKLDFEKLDKLKEFSSEMADAASGTAIAEAMGKLAEAMGKVGGGSSGSGGGGERNITIQLKMPNGRILEEHIVKDIDKVS
jgi:mevalonate kinase